MSAKKPWFKARIGTARLVSDTCGAIGFKPTRDDHLQLLEDSIFVRVVDARELTAEKAVERVLQAIDDESALVHTSVKLLDKLAQKAGMTATAKNGKVTVRRAKR